MLHRSSGSVQLMVRKSAAPEMAVLSMWPQQQALRSVTPRLLFFSLFSTCDFSFYIHRLAKATKVTRTR